MQSTIESSGVLTNTSLAIIQERFSNKHRVLDVFMSLISKLHPSLDFSLVSHVDVKSPLFQILVNKTPFHCRYELHTVGYKMAELLIEIPVDEIFNNSKVYPGANCILQVQFNTDLIMNSNVNYTAKFFVSQVAKFRDVMGFQVNPLEINGLNPSEEIRTFIKLLSESEQSDGEVRITIN